MKDELFIIASDGSSREKAVEILKNVFPERKIIQTFKRLYDVIKILETYNEPLIIFADNRINIETSDNEEIHYELGDLKEYFYNKLKQNFKFLFFTNDYVRFDDPSYKHNEYCITPRYFKFNDLIYAKTISHVEMKNDIDNITKKLISINAIGPDFVDILYDYLNEESIYIYLSAKFIKKSAKVLLEECPNLDDKEIKKIIAKVEEIIDTFCGLDYFEEICSKNQDFIESNIPNETPLIGRK